jgi:hypothetical protein
MRTTPVACLLALGLSTLPVRADDFLKPDNWEGLPNYWKLEGTTLTGNSGAKGLTFNTFWCSKTKYKDFELRFKVRLKDGKGNSGVQIRSKIHDPARFAVTGPQADIGEGWWGSLYGENFGGMMKMADRQQINAVLKPNDFNDYSIKVVGKHVTIRINGVTAVDQDFDKMPEEGIIAFQLHAGGPMEVTFKDITFKELK